MHNELKETRRKREKRGLRVSRSIHRSDRPRLAIFRSAKHIYGQIIDDEKGVTLVGFGSYAKQFRSKKVSKKEIAKEVGLELAKLAESKKIKEVVFDRGHYKFHGRLAAFAEGAREGGLSF